MTRFVPLGGFLGAGKTTTLIAAAKALEAGGTRVAIVTNDQGTELIDTRLARLHLDVVGEVTGGCFCCRFDDLMAVTGSLLERDAADVIIAEAVGSCTDLQATVVRPLRALHGDRFTVAPLTTVIDPVRYSSLSSSLPLLSSEDDMAYLYGHQLAEADIIAVNKGDLLGDATLAGLVSGLRSEYPHATVLCYSARTGRGLADLIGAWHTAPSPSPVVDIDYDRYAAAEAELAWFNRSYVITAPPGFSPGRWSSALLEFVSAAAAANRWTVGHAKVCVEVPEGLTKLSLTAAGGAATVDAAVPTRARQARASLNARIACEPRDMDRLAAGAVAAADAASGAASAASGPPQAATAFKPGYPRPVHRITGKTA
jgi:G3E family GTPase